MRTRRWRSAGGPTASVAAGIAAGLLALAMSGCGAEPPVVAPTPDATTRPADRDALAALAATAKDRRYVATYRLAVPGQPDRSVTVALATDGSWVVAVPGGALGGLVDVAMFESADGLFQCALGPATGAAERRPDVAPITPGCVKVRRLTAATDPRVHHIFTDWIDALTDRATALSVAAAPSLTDARGQCYSVQSTSAALAPPVDPGIYCYDADGILTAAQAEFGTLTLAGPVAPAPPSVAQPAATMHRTPLPMRAPPRPSPSASPEA